MITPDRVIEKELLSGFSDDGEPIYLAGVDEVGRGALAGPASVGIALVSVNTTDDFPVGLRDSKLMSAPAREAMVTPVRSWVAASAVGHSLVDEVNEFGIMGALRAAAARALAQLDGYRIGGILLDGSHNWWASDGLFEVGPRLPQIPVRTEVKGDARCAVVAAASVLAKVERDALMIDLAQKYPGYDWEKNKGYAAKAHIAGLARLGATPVHRTSWNLPGLAEFNARKESHARG
ncbi:MAG: ribonuclease HII [Actinomycetaceae bacterium]|nr:ribonuclease HII [Actinomycetaceae bacterium]